MSIRSVIETAKHEIAELTGRRVEAVIAVEPDADKWRLSLELVELERVPASTSVMGSYGVVVDDEGHVLEYSRNHRYYNNRADEHDGT